MKKFLLLTISFAFTVTIFSQLQVSEQFNNPPFTASGNLGTLNGWTQTGTGTDVQVNFQSDNTGAVTYPDYTSGRTYVTVGRYTTGGSNGSDPYKSFNSAVSTAVENVVYISFVVNVTAAQNTGDYCLALRSSGGNYLGRFAVRNNAGSVNFGVETNGTGWSWTGNYSYNTNYFIIMRYDNPTGNNNDDVYLWVNPSTLSQPTLGSADASKSNSGDNWGGSTISALALLQNGTNACNAKFDGFRVAVGTGQSTTTANAAAAWENLAPQGTPLPVKFGNINVSERTDGMLVNWMAYSETEVDRYIVERSANGREFTRIGEVSALNNATEIKYNFLDAAPLSGISFYRIINLDRSGKTGYSNIVRVNLDKDQTGFVCYPNPARSGGQFSFSSASLKQGIYQIRLFNAAGQQVYGQQLVHGGGMINQTISLPTALKTGFYTISLDQAGQKAFSKSILIQ